MLDELPVLVCDSDLHVAHLALQLCTTVSKATGAATVPAIKSAVLPKCLGLLQSSLLQVRRRVGSRVRAGGGVLARASSA